MSESLLMKAPSSESFPHGAKQYSRGPPSLARLGISLSPHRARTGLGKDLDRGDNISDLLFGRWGTPDLRRQQLSAASRRCSGCPGYRVIQCIAVCPKRHGSRSDSGHGSSILGKFNRRQVWYIRYALIRFAEHVHAWILILHLTPDLTSTQSANSINQDHD